MKEQALVAEAVVDGETSYLNIFLKINSNDFLFFFPEEVSAAAVVGVSVVAAAVLVVAVVLAVAAVVADVIRIRVSYFKKHLSSILKICDFYDNSLFSLENEIKR